MNKRCGRCSKPVYPTEELKCLDKVWHKSCFKCEVCGMTLNMKNYKGYDKKPFCVAHYPTTKFTSVADTPENRRIATNTKIQSSIQYHSDFEKQKGSAAKMTADSIEMKRHLENAKNASMIKYHEDFEKQKGKLITIADDPELQRIKQNTQIQSEISYKGIKQTRDFMEQRRPDQAAQVDKSKNTSAAKTVEKVAKGKESSKSSKKAPAHHQNPYAGKGLVSKAIYDYSAADTDEVSFMEGDIIIHCQPIDQGWMEGTVERTGERGMLPSNYVQTQSA
ncbi:LIM zinc-binding domain-containing Nebulette isoform X27 [Octopus vulgaris]|uniref:LIM zinc-binding domain-containing Nebulette isoform X27 n=1 Tax=Octopus vulgaris TaxID=6645 RepID=A0AA36AZK6_OCTVU|nr:LIM zinc-binding domain-containing Nebulette isoform X27 [Octopus vulgaris]